MAQRRRSLRSIYAQRKREAVEKSKITREMNKFIKEHKQQIVTKGREDLGNISEEKILDIFKANFRERQGDSLSFSKAKRELKNTLHTETFTGRDVIDYENALASMSKDSRKEFRELRGWKSKVDYEKFKRVEIPKGEDDIRARYEYEGAKGTILLTLKYNADGSYAWFLRMAE